MGKSLVLGHVFATGQFQQLFVQHHDQGIHIRFEFLHAQVSVGHAAAAFKLERLGDHAHGEDAHLFGNARNHRRCTRACATTHAGGDEQHVRAFDGGADIGFGALSGFAAFFRLAASAQTGLTQLDEAVRRAAGQGLRVGVGADEFNALNLALDHVLHGVAAAAADTDHFDLGALVELFCLDHFDGHGDTPKWVCSCRGFLSKFFLGDMRCQHRHGREAGGLPLARYLFCQFIRSSPR